MFDTAGAGLLGRAVQRRSGATVYPPDPPPTVGLTVLVGLGFGAAWITARRYARLGAPVTAMVQRVVTERYRRALSP